jgi:hypothetical protein
MLAFDPAKRITPLVALSHPFFQPILQEKTSAEAKNESPTAHNNSTPTKQAEASNKPINHDAMKD